MAGAIEQGGFAEEPKDEEAENLELDSPELVKIETEAFSAEAIGLYDMPGEQVLNVFSTPGIGQMPKMIELLKLSLMDPQKADYISILSFRELSEVVGQWIAKSESGSVQISFGIFE